MLLCTAHHNALREFFPQFCHRAWLGGQLEVGHGSGADSPNSRPADILVPNWMIGKPAVLDLIVVSPLNSNKLNEAGATGLELQGGSYRAGATGRELQGGSYRAGATGWELQGGSYRVGATGGSAAQKAKARKHNANDHKCRELGWVCILLAVETYGC